MRGLVNSKWGLCDRARGGGLQSMAADCAIDSYSLWITTSLDLFLNVDSSFTLNAMPKILFATALKIKNKWKYKRYAKKIIYMKADNYFQ